MIDIIMYIVLIWIGCGLYGIYRMIKHFRENPNLALYHSSEIIVMIFCGIFGGPIFAAYMIADINWYNEYIKGEKKKNNS